MSRFGVALAAVAFMVVAHAAPPAEPLDGAAVDRAQQAMVSLQQRLSARLLEEMGKGGPTAAVRVCRDEAQKLTAAVSAEQGVELGRTSHRLRNPANAPRPWVAKLLPAYAGRQAAEVAPAVVDLGDRVGVVKPLPTQPLCLACHGERKAMTPEVLKMLSSAYPRDEATGFVPGEVRGVIWAEVPKIARGAD